MEVIKWKFDGLFHADAQAVATEIQDIGESATPRQIVDKAKDENTELHKCFEWNDEIAADKYRLQQARQIVCHLVYTKTEDEQGLEQPQIRVFHVTDRNDGYKPTKLILCNEDEYTKLLERAKCELNAFAKKYENIKELDEVFKAIAEI